MSDHSDMTGCQHIRQSLGVYVLGAIDPAERAAVDAHLPGCAECREELAGLAGLPALLGRVPPVEAARIAGSDFDIERLTPGDEGGGEPVGAGDTLTPLLGRIAQRRRMNRWRALTAAAAVVLIAAGSAIGAVTMSGSPGSSPSLAAPGHGQRAAATDAASQARAVVWYAGMPWGTSLDTEVSGIPAGTTCQFWVLGSDGRRWQAGGWTVASTWQNTWYQGSAPAPLGAVAGFEITSGRTVLLHIAT
jgi:hypothetical protein